MKIKFLAALCVAAFAVGTAAGKTKVILKFDDLGVKNGVVSCARTMDYLKERGVKASFGVIADRLDATAAESLKPYMEATDKKGMTLFEIWHHGLDHKKPEFSGTPYEYQKEHFEKADAKIKEVLGLEMVTFGSPYNATDETTNTVLEENPRYKIFLFCAPGLQSVEGMTYLNNRVNIENGTGNIEYDHFLASYRNNKNKYTDYMVMQAHPNGWGEDKVAVLGQIVDFLLKEGCEFVTPQEYVKGLKKK